MATAAPDQVKHDVIYLGIRMQTMCMKWDTDNWKDLEFMMNKQVTVDLPFKPWGEKSLYCYNMQQQTGGEVKERGYFNVS